jgi:hypothetical protein
MSGSFDEAQKGPVIVDRPIPVRRVPELEGVAGR